MVEESGETKLDAVAKVEDVRMKNMIICVKREDIGTPYLLDTTDPMDVKTSILMSEGQMEQFSLLKELLPDPQAPLFQRIVMNQKELETRMITRMFNNCFERAGYNNAKIYKVEKNKNQFVQEKFCTEVKLMARKYPTKAPSQLVKLLFHGSG